MRHLLFDAMFSDGPPENEVYLMATHSVVTAHGKIDTYNFRAPSYGTLWVTCLYRDTDLTITRAVDVNNKVCRITYEGPKELIKVTDIRCD